MPTTTNYSWTTPADTDLVKDGASAIRTLGSSADTTVKNLNPETTLGDIAYRSSTSNVNTRLGIGSTGQVLTVASGVPSWATPTSGGMTLISTTSLTGASVTLSAIPGTFNNLQLVVQNFRPSADNSLRLRINADTTANRHVNVDNQSNAAYDATSIGINIQQQESSVASQHLSITQIYDYTNTTTWKQIFSTVLNNGNTTSTYVTGAITLGAYNQIGAITSLVLLPEGGTFTSGTALLYGVK